MTADVVPIRSGLVADLTNEDYQRSPALSSSGARALINGTPAEFKWKRENPEHRTIFDVGNAVHAMVLGDPLAKLEVVPVMEWRTNAAKEARDKAYAEERIPINLREKAIVEQMVEAVRANPDTADLFDPDNGQPEQSFFYTDEATGVELRCRTDWLPNPIDGRMILPDLKTADTADPDAFVRSAANLGYNMQASWYVDAMRACGLADDPAFVFVVVAKNPPHLVSVVMLDDEALDIGRHLNRKAIDLFKRCTDSDDWPGYGRGVHVKSMPRWYVERWLPEVIA